jgi:hypothetical protein
MKLASVEPGRSAIIRMPADRASAGRFMIDLPPQVIAARTDARNRIGPYLRLHFAIGDVSDAADAVGSRLGARWALSINGRTRLTWRIE